MPSLRNQGEASRLGHLRRQGQRLRDDAALGRTRDRELRGLRHVFAVHQARLDGAPQARVLQRFLGAGAVGRVLRVGNGELAQAPVFERGGQILELAIGLQGRAWRHQDTDAAHGIGPPSVFGLARVGQLKHEPLIGRHEQVKGRTLQDLRFEVTRRTKHQPHRLAGLLLELRGDGFKGELQVGRRGHGGHGLRWHGRSHGQGGKGDPCAGP